MTDASEPDRPACPTTSSIRRSERNNGVLIAGAAVVLVLPIGAVFLLTAEQRLAHGRLGRQLPVTTTAPPRHVHADGHQHHDRPHRHDERRRLLDLTTRPPQLVHHVGGR